DRLTAGDERGLLSGAGLCSWNFPRWLRCARDFRSRILHVLGCDCLCHVASPSSACLAFFGDLQHLWNLFLVLPAVTEAMGPLGSVGNLRLQPVLVARLVLSPHLPLTGVVSELSFIDHGDAVIHRANRFTDAASAARLHVRVVQTVGRDVKARV